jgi:serine/threonine protein kinase
MERLQGSPRVVDIYGYCGTTVATEYISGPKLQRVVKNKTPMQKLSLATQIAEAVADLHSIDGDQPSITHGDIYEDNILFTPDGRPKLHDFNLGTPLMTKGDTNVTCKGLGSKVTTDIAALGNLFFIIATGGKKQWDGIHPRLREKIQEKLKEQGVHHAPFPDAVANSSDPAMQTLVKAFKASRPDSSRPTARQLVAFLRNETSTI